MQVVPPPMTGNYLPSGPDIEIDDSQYTYGPRKSQPSESESQTTELDTFQPKVWSDAPIIEEYESDGDNEYVSVQTKGPSPSFANKQVKTPRENVKNQSTHSQKPKPIVNDVRPANVFHKTHSPSSRPFKRTTVLRPKFSKQKVYTAKVKEVSTVGGKWDTAVKSSAGCKWRTQGYFNNILSKYNGGSRNLGLPWTFKSLWLALFVAFGGSKGYITGKGKIKTGKLDFEDDETVLAILKDFIRQNREPMISKVKTIRCDNGTEFKNRDIIEFCGLKGIKREYSNARTPQQNGVAERKNKTLIEAARTMLADSFFTKHFFG
ncbi:ribonuclease H-like domain-containing protein [Tanacetum coccineum]